MAGLKKPAGLDAAITTATAVAMAARDRAYAPYSRFRVGAAVVAADGSVYGGANIENAAYPQGLCAEAVALAAMVMAGRHRVHALVVVGDGTLPVTPCGGCRQKLREFSTDDTLVVCVDGDGQIGLQISLGQLLPHSFGPEHLA